MADDRSCLVVSGNAHESLGTQIAVCSGPEGAAGRRDETPSCGGSSDRGERIGRRQRLVLSDRRRHGQHRSDDGRRRRGTHQRRSAKNRCRVHACRDGTPCDGAMGRVANQAVQSVRHIAWIGGD
jgi:hypothetical protein